MARGHKADGVWASLRMLLRKGPLTLANRKKAVSRMVTSTAREMAQAARTGSDFNQSRREIFWIIFLQQIPRNYAIYVTSTCLLIALIGTIQC